MKPEFNKTAFSSGMHATSSGENSVVVAYGKHYTSMGELMEDQKIINEHGGRGFLYVLKKNDLAY